MRNGDRHADLEIFISRMRLAASREKARRLAAIDAWCDRDPARDTRPITEAEAAQPPRSLGVSASGFTAASEMAWADDHFGGERRRKK